jgi:hypothetical protein
MAERTDNLKDLKELVYLLEKHVKDTDKQDDIISDIIFNMYLLIAIEALDINQGEL